MDPQGYDAGKKVTGRKRHILVDTLGLLLSVAVHPADIQDRERQGAESLCFIPFPPGGRPRQLWSPSAPRWSPERRGWMSSARGRTSRAIDLRTVDRHPLASVGTLVLGLRCSWCPGSAPMPTSSASSPSRARNAPTKGPLEIGRLTSRRCPRNPQCARCNKS
jgi:Transposase DDE domain